MKIIDVGILSLLLPYLLLTFLLAPVADPVAFRWLIFLVRFTMFVVISLKV